MCVGVHIFLILQIPRIAGGAGSGEAGPAAANIARPPVYTALHRLAQILPGSGQAPVLTCQHRWHPLHTGAREGRCRSPAASRRWRARPRRRERTHIGDDLAVGGVDASGSRDEAQAHAYGQRDFVIAEEAALGVHPRVRHPCRQSMVRTTRCHSSAWRHRQFSWLKRVSATLCECVRALARARACVCARVSAPMISPTPVRPWSQR